MASRASHLASPRSDCILNYNLPCDIAFALGAGGGWSSVRYDQGAPSNGGTIWSLQGSHCESSRPRPSLSNGKQDALVTTVKTEGFRALYKGVVPPLVGAP
jgi:hypothetical protein